MAVILNIKHYLTRDIFGCQKSVHIVHVKEKNITNVSSLFVMYRRLMFNLRIQKTLQMMETSHE